MWHGHVVVVERTAPPPRPGPHSGTTHLTPSKEANWKNNSKQTKQILKAKFILLSAPPSTHPSSLSRLIPFPVDHAAATTTTLEITQLKLN